MKNISGFIFLVWGWVGVFLLTANVPLPFPGMADLLFMLFGAWWVALELKDQLGIKQALYALIWVAIVSAIVETIGTKTGVPFGAYTYTEAFGPMLAEVIPVAIPLAWIIVLFPVYAFVAQVAKGPSLRVVLCALGCTIVDLVIEPVACVVRGYWIWFPEGPYFTVPWSNSFGWFILSLFIALGLEFIFKGRLPKLTVPLKGTLTIVLLSFVASMVGDKFRNGSEEHYNFWFPILLGGLLIVVLRPRFWDVFPIKYALDFGKKTESNRKPNFP